MANGIATTTSTSSVVKIGRKKCRPFSLTVMVYAPESGYKAEVTVERACTASNDSIWKFVFDLFKKKASGDGFDQLVHVSYHGLNEEENAAIAGMVSGLTNDQADALADLHEKSKAFHDDPSPENQTAVTQAASGVVNAGN
jgi:hypothetical protein